MNHLEKVSTTKSEPRLVSWPSPQDYNEAIQNPQYAFSDEILRESEPELNIIGLPKPASGNFASVYRLFSQGNEWAVRCFLQPMSDQELRYEALSTKLAELNLPYLVGFEFIPEGIRIHGSWYPMIKMQWVSGKPLLEYVEENLHDSEKLLQLADSFKDMIICLRNAGIAHGDLQHGNIMVEENGQLRLVDYDGCYVPALAGKMSNELGHRNYQHPKRSAADFNENIDAFSARLIWLSLIALADDPSLWSRLHGGDECLLFRRQDMLLPEYSKVFHMLEVKHNEQIRLHAQAIRTALKQDVANLLPFEAEPYVSRSLPPLSAVLDPSTLGSSKQKGGDQSNTEHGGGKKGISPFAKYPAQWTTIITSLIIMFSAWSITAFSSWAAEIMSMNFSHDWVRQQRDRADQLSKINEMINLAENGTPPANGSVSAQSTDLSPSVRQLESSGDTPNLPHLLFQTAEAHKRSDPKAAGEEYQRAIDLSGKNGYIELSSPQLAAAMDYIGQQKLQKGDNSGIEYLDQAYKLYQQCGYFQMAQQVMRNKGNSFFNSNQFQSAFDTYLGCIHDDVQDNYSSQLVQYATSAALSQYDPSNVPADSNFKRLWDMLGTVNKPELRKNELMYIWSQAEALAHREKYLESNGLFKVIIALTEDEKGYASDYNSAKNKLVELASKEKDADQKN